MEKSQESARQRDALDNVGSATAVITNPTHFAVALKYTAGQAGAPEVVAMGRGPMALQIIDRAKDARVTTLRIPMLARALYFTSEIGGEIAEGLYNAVAVILAYVFRIDSGESMDMPELTLPPELRFDENGNLEQGAVDGTATQGKKSWRDDQHRLLLCLLACILSLKVQHCAARVAPRQSDISASGSLVWPVCLVALGF